MYFFLSLKHILTIHADLVESYGGALGMRDQNLLESALAQVLSTYGGEYLHENIFEMAAAYLFHIVKNHPFVDGNKRTGITAALMFLSWHNEELECSNDELYQFVINVAEGKILKKEIAIWLKKHCSNYPDK